VPKTSPRRLAQRSYEAFAAGDRKFFEQHLAEDFTFSSPLDVGNDRNTEILRIKDNKIISVEVYFGWDLVPDH
jgi:hypothetical protein